MHAGAVTGDKSVSTWQRVQTTWAKNGFRGFYPGGVPIAFRQATNWASREGFTVATRQFLRNTFHGGDSKARLSAFEEVGMWNCLMGLDQVCVLNVAVWEMAHSGCDNWRYLVVLESPV